MIIDGRKSYPRQHGKLYKFVDSKVDWKYTLIKQMKFRGITTDFTAVKLVVVP